MKIFIRILCVFGAAALLAGCPTTGGLVVGSITPEVRNAIAYCGAGIESESVLKIEGAIKEHGGKIDAGLSDKLSGIFASRTGLTSADAIASQKMFMECLDKKSSKDKTSSIDVCQAKLACEIDTLQMLCNCTSTTDKIAIEKGYPDAFRDKILKEQCFSGQYDVRKCWNGEDVNNARASCTVILQSNGRELPTAMKGTCLAKQKG